MPIIEVNHVTKEFKLGQVSNLKQTFVNGVKRLTGHAVEAKKPFKALDDVSFSVEKGEVIGIIGHNGAGKSTLLKLLSGISKPTKGTIKVGGHIAPLIEVGTGFIPDFTGRENVYLNGSIYGLKRKDIEKKFDEIVSFAEMEQFIDTPVKRYSSGMLVKLAFSVATSMDAEILILDEVLAVGDLAFQRKCFDRVEELILRQGRTVFLISHNIRQVQRLCNRVLLLDHGKINMEGPPKEVCDAFYKQNDEKIKVNIAANSSSSVTGNDLEILDIYFRNAEGEITTQLEYDENCSIHFRIRTMKDLVEVIFGFGFHTTDFLFLSTCGSEEQIQIDELPKGEYDVACEIRKLQLLPGIYSIRFGVTATKACISVFYGENLKHFQITGSVPIAAREGFFELDADWRYQSDTPSANFPGSY